MSKSVHRSSGDSAMRRLADAARTAALLGAVFCAGLPAVAQERPNADAATKQLEESKRKLEQAREREQSLTRDRETLARERAELNRRLIATAQRVQIAEAKLSEIEERLAQLEGQETMLRASIEQRHEAIAKLLSAMQSMGREPPPALVARRDDALEMVRSAMLLANIFPELKFQADSLADDLKDLVRLGDGIREERNAQAAESEKLHVEQLRIAGLIEEKKSLLARNKTELARIREAQKRHASEVTYLGELTERMKKELSEAAESMKQYEKELAEAKVRKRRQPAGEVVELAPEAGKKYAFLSPGRIKPGIPFGTAKAALPHPVAGETIRRFGDAEQHGGKSEGEWVRTRKQARVVAPADGWIVYAGEFRSYGQLLIIDTGGGYHVLLAGMERIDADVGQFVLASEPVAIMGSTPSDGGNQPEQGRPVLYIEFRKDGRPVNPAPWWAKFPEKVQG